MMTKMQLRFEARMGILVLKISHQSLLYRSVMKSALVIHEIFQAQLILGQGIRCENVNRF